MAPGLQSPLQQQSSPAGMGPRERLEVNVNLNNAPPGTRVETVAAAAPGVAATTNVGYALNRTPRFA